MEDKYSRTLDSAITRMGHLRAGLRLIGFRQSDPTSWPTPDLDISERFLQRTSGSIQQTSKSNCTYGILTPIFSRINYCPCCRTRPFAHGDLLSGYPIQDSDRQIRMRENDTRKRHEERVQNHLCAEWLLTSE